MKPKEIENKGPFLKEEIQKLLDAGEVNLDYFAWKEDMAEWKPLNEIGGFTQDVIQSEEKKLDQK